MHQRDDFRSADFGAYDHIQPITHPIRFSLPFRILAKFSILLAYFYIKSDGSTIKSVSLRILSDPSFQSMPKFERKAPENPGCGKDDQKPSLK